MYDLIIIGSGPAGLSAAVYAKRAGLDEMVIEIILAYADWGDVLDILYDPQKTNSNGRYTIFVQTTK